MAGDFRKTLKNRPIVFDGSMGTMLQKLGLKSGGCPDELVLTDPEMILKVHRGYREAGADVITTNTFGGNRLKLREYGLGERVSEINEKAALLARKAAGSDGFVAGDLAPTGAFLEPVGDLSFDEALEIFTEQAGALAEGGADLVIIETMMDIREVKAAIMAAKDVGMPVAVTMTFDETMRTVLGTSPEAFAVTAGALGADLIGANCSLGSEGILKAVTAMSALTDTPLMAQPNAGIPFLNDKGETLFPDSPEEMAAFVPEFIKKGVRAYGGCCGTTPAHIKAIGEVFRAGKPVVRDKKSFGALSSRTDLTLFGGGEPPVIIGERINPTGRKSFAREIRERKISRIRQEAREQADAGAHTLDVNVGVPGVDEVKSMTMAVFAVNENSTLPLVIDSSDPAAMEAGLKAVDGRALVNSISGEAKKLDIILPLAARYGAAVLGLTLDDSGIPDTAEGRLKVAETILKRALAAGLRSEDVIIDCLAMTVSAVPESALTTLNAIRLVKKELGLATVLGVSNISFGLPARGLINSHFLSMAISAGLDCAIINPKTTAMMDAYYSASVLMNKDIRAERFISYAAARPESTLKPLGGGQKPAPGAAAEAPREIKGVKDKLKYAIIDGDRENIVALVDEALGEGLDVMDISNNGLIAGLNEVGKLFASNRYFLPQVMLSAETMKRAFARLKKEFKEKSGPSLGRVLLATVEGDIHDIGKNIVATLLENHGFEVIDLGKNVPTERILEEAVKRKVDIVGLSALMTTTVMEMDNIIKKLREKGIKVTTIVGGAVVTEEFSKNIGADEYGGDALSAVEKLKKLMEEKV
ncbi:MAG: homocysteine S-methyltransferase family protein [Thermodesulfobacteriota bacterium]